MPSFTRKNAWNSGGTFANPDLLWYAKGVGEMQSRALDDPNSWWFFAAIHGQLLTRGATVFPNWFHIPGPPQVPTTPLPSQDLQELYWDQCQHQSWYFGPWHRGYLIALEAQIRAAIAKLGCPSDWALPYWNYFGPDDQHRIPPAFTEQTLPDGTANPLFIRARYGPRGDNDIFVGVDANEDCQRNTIYTGFNADTPPPGYGGPETGFLHGSGDSGNLENNPHNLVHGHVGGQAMQRLFSVGMEFVAELDAGQLSSVLRQSFETNGFTLEPQVNLVVIQAGSVWRLVDGVRQYFVVNSPDQMMLFVYDVALGLMTNPGMAALDPIFYLHHANIDRMWAAWNGLGNSNPTSQDWLAGPEAVGERRFAMPMPDGSTWTYTPADMDSLNQLDFTYDDLSVTVLPQPSVMLARRLMTLGVAPAAAMEALGRDTEGGENVELLGANDGSIQIKSSGARTTVMLDTDVRGRMFASLADAPETSRPDRVYLRLENVRGTIDALELRVSVNQQNLGTVGLFGLEQASSADGHHGGAGLSFDFDITDIIDNQFLADALDVNSLDVRIEPNHAMADIAQLTVGRVSVYRQGMS